jgi:hypothetical protein
MAELIVRGSEYQSFLNCRKQWYYQWVEGIEAKKPDKKLFFGTAFHKWLENYYNSGCNKLQADLETSIWINEQDTKDMDQTDIDDMMSLMRGVAEHYHNTYGETDKDFNVIATELEFIIKLDDSLYMTGTIDLVYEVDGKIRFMDHKTVSSITMYEEKAVMDRQISRYWWALKMIAAGIGEVKDKETGEWVQCEALKGKSIDGFDYNLIAKDFPKEPKVLKSGKLSTDKSQKTTYNKYLKKLLEMGIDVPEDSFHKGYHIIPSSHPYYEILTYLAEKPDQFTKRVDVRRSDAELESSAWEFSYTAGDIHDIKLMIKNNPNTIEPLTYRNITNNCMHMCQFKSLCQTAIDGGNVNMVKNLGYKQREEK